MQSFNGISSVFQALRVNLYNVYVFWYGRFQLWLMAGLAVPWFWGKIGRGRTLLKLLATDLYLVTQPPFCRMLQIVYKCPSVPEFTFFVRSMLGLISMYLSIFKHKLSFFCALISRKNGHFFKVSRLHIWNNTNSLHHPVFFDKSSQVSFSIDVWKTKKSGITRSDERSNHSSISWYVWNRDYF